MTEIIKNWIPWSHQNNEKPAPKGIAKFVLSGSHRLGAATIKSDIDGVILVPRKTYWQTHFEKDFFGNFDCISKKCVDREIKNNSEDDVKEENESLFCKLCENPHIENLRKIYGRVPIIRLKYAGFQFDLSFATLEEELLNKLFKDENSLNVKNLDEAIEKFREKMPDTFFKADNATILRWRLNTRLGMIFALSGVRSTLRFIELLDRNIAKFKLAYITVKLWARNHFIYGGNFGFLNGSSLTVLVSKIVIENPNNSLISIIMELFEYLVEWFDLKSDEEKIIMVENPKDYENSRKVVDWNLNRELKQREEHFKNLLGEGYEKHSKVVWPIILPGFPTQNSGFNINSSTGLIMKNEMENGNAFH
uniref:polynucleotide adenylyltransferase n=1 Tax=Meloidogyne incognita TaxID=6306 RepID=A0A914LE31_MELIC